MYRGEPRSDYRDSVVRIARWSEEAGAEGMLIYTDNSLPDPWLIADAIIRSTERICPLVAVQPLYMHPYAVAKLVSSLGFLYGRRVYLNMVSGGFKNDLLTLGDTVGHDRRYDRLVEYTRIILRLLEGGPVTYHGEFYHVENCRLTPPLPRELFPLVTLAGSSAAGAAAAQAVGAISMQYPEPPDRARISRYPGMTGVRIGVIARPDAGEAWDIAHRRFPPDRAGKLAHELAAKVSDSSWHRTLTELAVSSQNDPYWLVPFENYRTFCPYLVGSYSDVATALRAYLDAGHETFIMDIPASPEDLFHIRETFAAATGAASKASA